MADSMDPLPQSRAWQKLQFHRQSWEPSNLCKLVTADSQRFEHFCLTAAQITVDFSKNYLTQQTWALLAELAAERGVSQAIQKLFAGEYPNINAEQAVLHPLLRNIFPGSGAPIHYSAAEVSLAREQFEKISQRSEMLRAYEWRGPQREIISDVIYIGIGGSSQGPRLGLDALRNYHSSAIRFHFLETYDGSGLTALLSTLSRANTLLVVASKSFATPETMIQANIVRQWLSQNGNRPDQIWAITANQSAALAWGVALENIFLFPPQVGGRFSLWSAVGFPILVMLGRSAFKEFLLGASDMDAHFASAPLARNIPVMLAALSIWYTNFFGATTQAILPYGERFALLVPYLQQLHMESNGKRHDINGNEIAYHTSPIIWGGIGTKSQHSFHQLILQGQHFFPVDFIVAGSDEDDPEQGNCELFANALAQAHVFMAGNKINRTISQDKQKEITGNIPSNFIVMPSVTPRNLGALLALYEHKVFVAGVIWHINSFDQWAVEYGKHCACSVKEILLGATGDQTVFDPSTQGLICYYHQYCAKQVVYE